MKTTYQERRREEFKAEAEDTATVNDPRGDGKLHLRRCSLCGRGLYVRGARVGRGYVCPGGSGGQCGRMVDDD